MIQAEHRALRGDVESQDSQLFLERYHQQYAPGLRSSSPSQPLPPEAVRAQVQQYQRPAKVHQRFAGALTASAPALKPVPKGKGKAKAQSKAEPEPNIQGLSADYNPAEYKGLQHTAAPAERLVGGARAKPAAAPDASTRTQRASSSVLQSSRHPSGQATLSETAKFPEHEPAPEHEVDLESAIFDPQTFESHFNHSDHLRNGPHGPIGTVNPSHLTLAPIDDDDGANDRNSRLPLKVSATSTKRRRAKKAGFHTMETSQSPTQSNDGRSYDQYLSRGDDLNPTESLEESEQLESVPQHSEHNPISQNEEKSLHDDDTSAVNFDNINRYNTEVTAPDSIGTDMTSSPGHLIAFPETPAPQKNPFAGSKSHVLASSQMFRQTQVSSACKVLSPTSSRPSPDNIQLQDLTSPNPLFVSPLIPLLGPSPLQHAVSSPQFLPPYDTPTQQARHEQAAPDINAIKSTPPRLMHKPPTGLVESYRPMHKFADRRDISQPDSELDLDDDASYNDLESRRHRAMLKKKAAEKQLRSITYERPSAPEDVVVPSTNMRNGDMPKTDSQVYLDQREGKAMEGSQDAVEDSQADVTHSEAGDIDTQQSVIDDSQAGVVLDTLPNTARSPTVSPVAAEDNNAPMPLAESNGPRLGDADAIPDTSPARLRPLGEMLPHSDEVWGPESFSNLLDSSFRCNSLDRSGDRSSATSQAQEVRRGGRRKPTKSLNIMAREHEPEHALPNSVTKSETVELSETSPVVDSSPPGPAVRTRTRHSQKHNTTSPEDPASSVSTLSVLATTPSISNKTTPSTQESSADIGNLTPYGPQTSPTVAKVNRRGSSGAAPKPKPKLAAAPQKDLGTSFRRSSRSFPRHPSVSTDELAGSTPLSSPRAFEQSVMLSRLGRTSLRETPASRETSRGGAAKIFTGMAFAISFQSRQLGEKDSHYNTRMGILSKLTDTIKQAGGRLLTDGFDQLFEASAIKSAEVASSTPPPDEEIKLTAAARNTGFTALIADGHSRKVKYMQALALGLPCIHERWITTCVEKQALVNWSDYLLCAGNSSFLGDAIRSRNLPSYDVASAKLNEVIKNRPQLLHGSRILLVLRKQDESKKMAYVFLARVLGASLSRVYTMEEARKQLKASEDAGHSYDWVYVDDKMATRADLFSNSTSGASPMPFLATGSKKRKRKSEAGWDAPPKKIRALSDELVIQSLILGRLIEEGEMGG